MVKKPLFGCAANEFESAIPAKRVETASDTFRTATGIMPYTDIPI
jgi:hypothetical protein